jgi:hypothetical protein
MSTDTFYIKEGRRYKPVSYYDSKVLDGFPVGSHMVMVYKGGSSRRFNVNPNYAAMIAAGRIAEDAISNALCKASDLRMQRSKERQLTPEQKAAWDHLVEVMGPEAKYLEWPSAREACEDAVKVMQEEAEKLMQHESVRKAYDHFQLMCELVKEKENA